MGLYTKSVEDKPPKEKVTKKKGRPKKVVEDKVAEPEVEKVEEVVKEEPQVPEKPLELPIPEHIQVLPEVPLVLVEEKPLKKIRVKRTASTTKGSVQPVHETDNEKKKKEKKPSTTNTDKEPPDWFQSFLLEYVGKNPKKDSEAKQIASDIWKKRQPKIVSTEGAHVDKIFNQIFGR